MRWWFIHDLNNRAVVCFAATAAEAFLIVRCRDGLCGQLQGYALTR